MAQFYSKVTAKSQTVLPRALREKLGIKTGDMILYRETAAGIVLERLKTEQEEDPLASFKEWASKADDEAYGDL